MWPVVGLGTDLRSALTSALLLAAGGLVHRLRRGTHGGDGALPPAAIEPLAEPALAEPRRRRPKAPHTPEEAARRFHELMIETGNAGPLPAFVVYALYVEWCDHEEGREPLPDNRFLEHLARVPGVRKTQMATPCPTAASGVRRSYRYWFEQPAKRRGKKAAAVMHIPKRRKKARAKARKARVAPEPMKEAA